MCIGVNSLTVSSPQSPKLWQAPLDPLISPSSSPFSDQWHSISLPGNTVGENNSIQQVASGLSHTIILSSSGRGNCTCFIKWLVCYNLCAVFSIGKGYFGQTGEWAHEDGGLLGEVMTGLKEGFVKQVSSWLVILGMTQFIVLCAGCLWVRPLSLLDEQWSSVCLWLGC